MKNSYLFIEVFQNYILPSVSPVAKTLTLMLETQQISEWFVSNLTLVQLVIQEDFNAFIHCENLKYYISIVLDI